MPPTMNSRQPRVVPPKQPHLGAGVVTSLSSSTEGPVPEEDLFEALQLHQGVMTSEDFSEYEMLVTPPKKEERIKNRELLWEKVQSQGRLQKQEAGHVEQLAKLEQQITQHQKMLQDVRSKLEVVNDEVCA